MNRKRSREEELRAPVSLCRDEAGTRDTDDLVGRSNETILRVWGREGRGGGAGICLK